MASSISQANKDEGNPKALTGDSETKTAKKIVALVRKYNGHYEDVMRTVVCLNEERKIVSKEKREAKLGDIRKELEELFTGNKTRTKKLDTEKKLNSIFADYKCRYKKFYTIIETKKQTKPLAIVSMKEPCTMRINLMDYLF